jgi:hypothetical protein
MDALERLTAADEAAAGGRMEECRRALREARFAANREGNLAALSAVMRREASLLLPADRGALLVEAARLAQRGGDTVGQIEALEDLSRDRLSEGRVGVAVALLGRCAELQAERGDRAGYLRGAMLAGRALCEAWGAERDVPAGMAMLLFCEREAGRFDDALARLLRDYLTGFQYTLSDAEFAAAEPWLELDGRAVVDATLTRYVSEFGAELP